MAVLPLLSKLVASGNVFTFTRLRERIADAVVRYDAIRLAIEEACLDKIESLPDPDNFPRGSIEADTARKNRFAVNDDYAHLLRELNEGFRLHFLQILEEIPREVAENVLTTAYHDRDLVPRSIYSLDSDDRSIVIRAYEFITDAPRGLLSLALRTAAKKEGLSQREPLHANSWEREFVRNLIERDAAELESRVRRDFDGKEARTIFAILNRAPQLSHILEREFLRRYLTEICNQTDPGKMADFPFRQRKAFLVFFDPEEIVAYTDPGLLKGLPPAKRKRLIETVALQSHSNRAFFLVRADGTVIEFKGLTPRDISTRSLHMHSNDPRGILSTLHALGEILGGEMIGDLGPILRYKEVKTGFTVDGDAIGYGQLARIMPATTIMSRRFTPWARMDLQYEDIVCWAELEGFPLAQFLDEAAANFGKQLAKLHRGEYFLLGVRDGEIISFLHPGNVEIHGNILDLESAIPIDEINAICRECGLAPLTVEQAAGKDIERAMYGLIHRMGKDRGIYFKLRDNPEIADQFVNTFIDAYFEGESEAHREAGRKAIMRKLQARVAARPS